MIMIALVHYGPIHMMKVQNSKFVGFVSAPQRRGCNDLYILWFLGGLDEGFVTVVISRNNNDSGVFPPITPHNRCLLFLPDIVLNSHIEYACRRIRKKKNSNF